MSRSTSFRVRCSRVRSSRFGRRRGVTVRFTARGDTNRKGSFVMEISLSPSALYEQSSLYEQYEPSKECVSQMRSEMGSSSTFPLPDCSLAGVQVTHHGIGVNVGKTDDGVVRQCLNPVELVALQ